MMKIAVYALAAGVLILSTFLVVGYVWPKMTFFDQEVRVENFRSFSQAFPTVEIAASSVPLDYDVQLSQLPEHYTFAGETRRIDDFLARSETTAFLVVKNGRIMQEAYFQGAEATDLLTSFSVAKSFVGTLVGIALHEGLIESLDDPITRYVPELAASGFDGVAISDILTMSSGIDFSEAYDDESTDAFTIYDKLFLYMRAIPKVMADYGSRIAAGTEFEYASINTQALGQLIEAVTGMPVSQYLEQRLWHPLGAASAARWSTDIRGNVISFWGLNATARDYARLGVLYAQRGRFGDRQIVSPDWIARATAAASDRLERGQIDTDWGYGYHWWLPNGAEGDFSAIGIWGQFIYVDPTTQTVIVKMSADPDFKIHEPEAIAAFRAIAAAAHAEVQE